MADDLTEIRERIKYARAETKGLAHAIYQFLSTSINRRHQPTADGISYDLYISCKNPVPVAIRAKAGMIANELRSCLDALASALAIRNNQTTAKVYFPVSKSKEIFDDDGMRKIKKLSHADQAKIVALQPYKESNELLFGLHEADRTRKHSQLALSAARNATTSIGNIIEIDNSSNVTIGQLTYNGEVITNGMLYGAEEINFADVGKEFCLATGVPNAVETTVSYNVVYSSPPELEGRVITESLDQFADEIERIVSEFS